MPWDMDDYPHSLKNFDKPLRKKAIDIANAMIDEGYSEGKAIPIATEQAKEWYKNASDKEIKDYEKHGDPTTHSSHYHSNPKLADEPECIIPHEDGWAVEAKGAKKAAKVFNNKQDAIEYGEKVAANKGTQLIIYDEDRNISEKRDCKPTH